MDIVRIIELLMYFSLLIHTSTCLKEVNYSDNHAKVLILGAGATGIKAAQVFKDNGMDDFLIIEGADYVGGRVKQETFANVTVELGAQWVAPGYTDIIDWALNDWKLNTFPADWDSVTLRNTEGQEIPDDEADPIWDRFEDAVAKTAEIAQDIVDNGKPDMSIKAALRLAGWVAKTPLEKTVEWYTYDFETAEISDVTSLLSIAFTNYDDNTFLMIDQRGYSVIFDKIAPFLSTAKYAKHTRLNQRVTQVDSSKSDKLVRVHCDDGTIYTGEYVLVTFSLGVLQSDLVEFKPTLPDWKIEELYQMRMTAYGSIFMKFPNRFWDDEQQLLHVNGRYNFYPYFLNLDAAGHLPNNTHILVAHILGEEAWRIEYQSEEETKEEVESVLQHMYGLTSPPRATEFRVVTDWLQNPLTMGSYSDWPVEISQECFLKLQARVGQVFFGGEATHEDYYGYVYGALLSGEREANKIIGCMQGNECPAYKPAPKKCDCNKGAIITTQSTFVLSMVIGCILIGK